MNNSILPMIAMGALTIGSAHASPITLGTSNHTATGQFLVSAAGGITRVSTTMTGVFGVGPASYAGDVGIYTFSGGIAPLFGLQSLTIVFGDGNAVVGSVSWGSGIMTKQPDGFFALDGSYTVGVSVGDAAFLEDFPVGFMTSVDLLAGPQGGQPDSTPWGFISSGKVIGGDPPVDPNRVPEPNASYIFLAAIGAAAWSVSRRRDAAQP